MSNWTHVAAIARIDHILCFSPEELDFEKLFGKTVNYGSPYELFVEALEHPDSFLPYGSEGSLEMSVWTNPSPEDVTRYTVSIFGDLRDHDDPESVVRWFRKKLKWLLVRQASIIAQNERNGTASWFYDYDDEEE